MRHYPTGASKWNIIERRLFSEISKEWAGRPFDRYGTILNYIRRTKTEQGLTVTACLIRKKYSTGIKVTDEEMKQLRLKSALPFILTLGCLIMRAEKHSYESSYSDVFCWRYCWQRVPSSRPRIS
jgi:hypothetical protein